MMSILSDLGGSDWLLGVVGVFISLAEEDLGQGAFRLSGRTRRSGLMSSNVVTGRDN